MQIESLDFSHQDVLQKKFRQLDLPLSEYSFANLYLFRKLHRYEVVKIEEEMFIRGVTRDNIPFIMLTSYPTEISHRILRQALSLAEILFPVPENWLGLFDKFLEQASFKEADSDYLYARSKLETYSGRHLDGKRNQIKQMLNQHDITIQNLSKRLEDAQQILNDWQEEKKKEKAETDYLSCQEGIQSFQRLNLQGKILDVDQKPSAFIIGECLSKDCFAFHFCKALHSIKGLYPYLLQDAVQSLTGICPWINLEQDLGIPGLRESKLSYQPDWLGKKWRLQLRLL